MGLFNKRKEISQTDKSRAANLFAERDKQPEETVCDGMQHRIQSMGKLTGAETVERAKTSEQRLAELRQTKDDSKHADEAIKGLASAHRNETVFAAVEPGKKDVLTEKQRKQAEKEGMSKADHITAGLKNKSLLTEVKADGKDQTKNLNEKEIGMLTAGFRNVGLITEVQAGKAQTATQKREQDLQELENAESVIATYANFNFHKSNASPENKEGGE